MAWGATVLIVPAVIGGLMLVVPEGLLLPVSAAVLVVAALAVEGGARLAQRLAGWRVARAREVAAALMFIGFAASIMVDSDRVAAELGDRKPQVASAR
jgi:hypothetical protein